MSDKVRAAERRLLDAIRAECHLPAYLCDLDHALRDAEEEAKRPRLMPAEFRGRMVSLVGLGMRPMMVHPDTHGEAIKARDAEWLTAIRALPTVREKIWSGDGQGCTYGRPCVALADIEAIAERAK